MSKSCVLVLLSAIILFICRPPAYADTATAISEVYLDNGLPVWEQPAQEGLYGILGAGYFRGTRITGDPRLRTVFLPVVLLGWENKAFWSISGGGVWLYHSRHQPFKLGIGLKVHPGYDPDGDPNLIGMEKRYTSIDGSVNALWETRLVNIGASYYHDISHVTRGESGTIRLSHHIQITPKLTVTPRAGLEYEDARLVGYYYGVQPSEALPDRPAYTGHHVVNYGIGAVAVYRLSRSWSLVGGFFANHLSNGISDSPIVLQRHTKVAFLSAGWTF
jgi:MipA family protein